MDLSESEQNFLKTKWWWSPEPHTQYYIKGGLFNSTILILITNINHAWIARLDKDKVTQDKIIYNKMLQLEEDNLLDLLSSKVSSYSEGGIYSIVQKQPRIEFSFKIYLKIYMFNWKIVLEEVKVDLWKMIRDDLVEPLIAALMASERVIERMVKGRGELQKEVERWRDEVGDVRKGELSLNRVGMSKYRPLDCNKVEEKGVKKEDSRSQPTPKDTDAPTTLEESLINERELKKSLEDKLEKDKLKKKKKIDFI